MSNVNLSTNAQVMAQELVLNGPLHLSQIPDITDQKTGLGREGLAELISHNFAHPIVVRGDGHFVAASSSNPFLGGK